MVAINIISKQLRNQKETISFVTQSRIINNRCKKRVAEAIKAFVAPLSLMRSFSHMPFLASKRPANVISDVLPEKTCGYVFSLGEPRARCGSARINLIILLMSYERTAPLDYSSSYKQVPPAAYLATGRGLCIVLGVKTCLGVF